MGFSREINVSLASSRDEGSCNGCTRFTTPDGIDEHIVTVISLRHVSMRVCDNCMGILLKKLFESTAKKKPKTKNGGTGAAES